MGVALSGPEVRLAPNQVVGLAPDAILWLEPNASVRVVGDLKTQVLQRSKMQLQLDNGAPANVFTRYTIFRNVIFGSGIVVTAWSYDLSGSIRPKAQYRYYQQQLQRGLAVKYVFSIDGAHRPPHL